MNSKKKPVRASKAGATARKAEPTDSDFSLPNSHFSLRQPGLVPKLRFPQFRGADWWKIICLDEVLSPVVRERPKPTQAYSGLGVRSHGRGTFLKPCEDPEKNSMDKLYEVKPNDLIVNITFAWEGAVAIAQACDFGALVSHRFPTYTFEKRRATPDFFRYVILDKRFVYNLV